jgi:hypothetical protein
MQTHANSQEVGTSIGWTFGQARDQAKRLGARIVKLIEARADACAAAAVYEQLSRLSNAELERRGISRGELHRCIFETLTKRCVERLVRSSAGPPNNGDANVGIRQRLLQRQHGSPSPPSAACAPSPMFRRSFASPGTAMAHR